MSSTVNPAAVAVAATINEAAASLSKRLLPAKLKEGGEDGKKNGHVFNSWVIRKGLVLANMTAVAIANALYEAVQYDCQQQFPQLVWENEPKILKLRREQGKAPSTRQDTTTVGDFEKKVREGEKVDQARKAQEVAKKEALDIVAAFHPLHHRTGRPNYTLEAEKKAEWRKRINEHKGDFVALRKQILQEQRDLYRAAERAAERI